MKNLVFISIFLCFAWSSAQEINWLSLEEAVALQQESPKKIMVDAYTVWCGPCKLLDKNTFHNEDVVNFVNENYYAVKFNAEGNDEINFKDTLYKNPGFDPSKKNGRNASHDLARYFRVSAYPTILFLDEKSDLIGPIPGYKTPKQLELFLKLFSSDAYKGITTKEHWEEYVANFNYAFKE